MTAAVSAAIALTLCAALVVLGRRDLSRPAVAFGVVWFACVAAAQLEWTPYQRPWSAGFAALVLGGGAIFVLAAAATAGTHRLRGTPPPLSRLAVRRLEIAAAVLFLGALAGLAWKASLLGGVPLFSDEVDAIRARAYGSGGSRVPGPATFLTNGFHLALWCLLLGAALGWRAWPWWRRAAVAAVSVLCLVGAFAGGSRNALLLAVAIPLVVAYLCSGPLSRPRALGLAASVLVLVGFASVVFEARISQRGSGETFYSRATEDRSPAVKPLMPAYIAGTYALETFRRAHDAFPARFSHAYGGYELTSMPDKAFPNGKPPVGATFGQLSYDGPGSATWTVASYQGRAFADFGVAGVLLVSLLLGGLFGALHRVARERRTLWTLLLAAYGVYFAAFMIYDNLLSFSVAVVYDLAAAALVIAVASRHGDAEDHRVPPLPG